MFDAELDGVTVFVIVAQRPFETASDSGVVNAFSLLKPILHKDGRVAEEREFPGNGYVWWMLRSATRGFAEPGRLLAAVLEEAEQVGAPTKSWYQARVDSIEPARASELVEVVPAPGDWVREPREMIGRNRTLTLDHPPLEQVYVCWQEHLYGPLRTSCEAAGPGGAWQVRFSIAGADHSLRKIAETALQKLPAGGQQRLRVDVSLVDRPPYQTGNLHTCRYRLIPTRAFDQAAAGSATRIVLESDEDLIKREAKKFLSRGKRQELNRLLEELLGGMEGAAETASADALRVVKALHERLGDEERAAAELAQALLTAGVLDEQVRNAVVQAEQTHVEKHAARLQTQIDERLQEARKALDDVEKKQAAAQQELKAQRQSALAALDEEIAGQRQEFEHACRDREEQLESQKRELVRQREVLSGNLAQVATQLSEQRDQLVNQFLAILPLLQQLNLFPPPGTRDPTPEAAVPPAAAAARPFILPPFVQGGSTPPPPTEEEFFERFCRHVEESGFKYRRLDLAGFHISVKCNDLTVLGGLPGTGKSSLPRLYAEALAGDELRDEPGRYLHVGVSPSWLDMRDLLGHPNTLDRCYQPAECGLYQFLIWAQEEEARRGLDARPYLVCLDEMNLAAVEHYFSGFLQALERPLGQREVRCFAQEVVSASDPFAGWPVLRLPPTLRFVGTVNFDETTRELSQRVLDRGSLIRLRTPYLLDAKDPGLVRPSGPPVTLRQLKDWVTAAPGLDRGLGELLDQLKEPLARLGCSLSPRRFNALRRVLGSCPPAICKPEEALDLQIAQRILPQVRHLFRPGAPQALAAIRKALESHPLGFPESLLLLDEIKATELSDDLLGEGGEE
jgi:hypothetical protein